MLTRIEHGDAAGNQLYACIHFTLHLVFVFVSLLLAV
jgi:hypothetical protein